MQAWFRRRVPYVPQMELSECGAACLTMVLGFHRKHVSLERVRQLCGGGRDGASAAKLYRGAQQLGLEVSALRAEPSDLHGVALPAILHWQLNHFVVLEQLGPRGARLVDPACGRREVSHAQLSDGFSGVVLSFAPGPQFEREAARRPSLARYWPLLRDQWPAWGSLLMASALLEIVSLALPAATQVLIDHVLLPQRQRWLLPLALLVIAAWAAGAVLALIRAGVLRRLHNLLDLTLMSGFVEHLVALPTGFFVQRSAADLLQRVELQCTLRDALSKAVSSLLDGLLLLGFGVLMLAYDARIGALIVAASLLKVAFIKSLDGRLERASANQHGAGARELGLVADALTHAESLRAFAGEDTTLDRYGALHAQRLNEDVAAERVQLQGAHLGSLLDAAALALVFWLGASEVLAERSTLGVFAGLLTLQRLFQAPLASLVEALFVVTRARGVFARIADVYALARVQSGSRTPATAVGTLQLRCVSFGHGSGEAEYRELELRIDAGARIAVVGRSGQGKSTLLRLLAGLAEPSAGRVCFDGIPLTELTPSWLAAQVGVVLQEPFFLDDSVRENLCLGDRSIDEAAIWSALQIACLDRVVAGLPEVLETRIGHAGARLSGGERQRLAIARAVLRRPRVLLLDEATSALDESTEAQLVQNLSGLACTQVWITHRAATLRAADRIIEVEAGRIRDHRDYRTFLRDSRLFAERGVQPTEHPS